MKGLHYICLVLTLSAVFIFLQYRLWFAAGGVRDYFRLQQALVTQQAETQRLRERNHALLADIARLQQSQDALEGHARHDLGMVKKGETFYQVVKPATAHAS